MKKIIYGMLVAVMFFGVTGVSAMTKDELKAKLTQTYEINGEKFRATDSQIVEIERYLEKNDVNSDDAEFISKQLDKAIAVIERGDATSLEELTGAEKGQIVSLINEVSNKTNINLTVDDGEITVYNLDGSEFTKVNDVVKYTDNSNPLIAVAFAVSAIGLVAIALKIKKANV